MYHHIYLSPHLDDAVLSCGGRIWHQVQDGERVLVVTVFAGSPAPGVPLSPFAQEEHTQWNLPPDAPAGRREEDRAALALLGAMPVHWHYADCIYRQAPDGSFPYASEEALWGGVHPAEESLVTELAAQIADLPLARGGAVWVPLGVGHHVDHQIVRRAATVAALSLIYYEDYPYAQDQGQFEGVFGTGQWRSELTQLSAKALAAKVAAVACYRSQLITLHWTDAAEMDGAVRTFADQTGGEQPAERYWLRDA